MKEKQGIVPMPDLNEYISAQEAAKILSQNSGRKISPDYVRMLASPRYHKITIIPIDGRTNLYKRSDVEALIISTKPGRKPRTNQTKQ